MALRIHHRRLITIGIVFILSWVVGTFLIHHFEAGYPIGENYFNAIYFTIITTATIGFGDLVPMTRAGQIVTMCYAVFYVPLFLYTMTLLFQINFDKIRRQDALLEEEMDHVERDVNRIIEDTPHHAQHKKKR